MLNEEIIEIVDIQYYIEVDGTEYTILEEENNIDLVMITQQGLPGVNGNSDFVWVEAQW